MRIVGK